MNMHLFSVDWFDAYKPVWGPLLNQTNPSKLLEIGSFEGRSTCFMIDYLSKSHGLELHCIDTWEGAIEHQIGGSAVSNMTDVERRFLHNVNLSISNAPNPIELKIHKGYSNIHLPKLLANGMNGYFDFIYIDGSHQAPDVLFDAVASFQLLKVGGLMFFDDYLWKEPLPGGVDVLRCPKPAIDAFTNIFARKIEIIRAPLCQLYIQKISN